MSMLAQHPCQTAGVVDLLTRLAEARLYLVCPVMPDEFLHAALDGGAAIVQLRAKDQPDAEVVAAARRFKAACAEHDALLIVNDRPDLAAAAGADGVHVGQDDMTVARAREIVGPDRIVGLSTHTPAQVDAAEGADYIGVGPVNATPTKPGRPAVGLDLVRYASAHARVPFFAIGGIDPSNIAAVRAAGAERVAVVRAIVDAMDPEAAARALIEEVRVGAT
jgi:thiamine-phosphate pyrophosphorylase